MEFLNTPNRRQLLIDLCDVLLDALLRIRVFVLIDRDQRNQIRQAVTEDD
jgi:hypothetical protein